MAILCGWKSGQCSSGDGGYPGVLLLVSFILLGNIYFDSTISILTSIGMFIAKISKGRTIKQFIHGTLTAPVLYSFIWLTIYGGAGINMERKAAGAGLCCKPTSGSFGWFYNNLTVVNLTNLVKPEDIVHSESSYFLCNNSCGSCATAILHQKETENYTYLKMLNEYEKLGPDFGSVSMDRSFARLSCHSDEQMWFDLLRSYDGIGNFLAFVSVIAIVLYFITSSDSGEL